MLWGKVRRMWEVTSSLVPRPCPGLGTSLGYPHTQIHALVSCPACTHLLAKNGLVEKLNFFLSPKSIKNQWDYKIINCYVALSLSSTWVSVTFFEYVWCKMLWMWLYRSLIPRQPGNEASYTVARACTSQRNSTWFVRPFFLMRGWGLGARLFMQLCNGVL